MTRINCVPAQELCNQHLFAEWRELPRIVNHVNAKNGNVNMKGAPQYYKLGTGHVKFFYNKLKFLVERHKRLSAELLRRGYNINAEELQVDIPKEDFDYLYNDWEPDQLDLRLNRQRIKERMPAEPRYTTKGAA